MANKKLKKTIGQKDYDLAVKDQLFANKKRVKKRKLSESKDDDRNERESEIIEIVDALFTKLDFARRNTLYANQAVQDQISYLGYRVEDDSNSNDNVNGEVFKINSKLPFLFQAYQTLVADFKNALFKNPEGMFNLESDVDNFGSGYDSIYKQYLLTILNKTNGISTFIRTAESLIFRGEAILFAEWKKLKGKKVSFELKEETSEYERKIEKYTTFEGVVYKAIEPADFVFDVTKLSSFTGSNYDLNMFQSSSCVKIVRSWHSLNDIISNEEYSLSDDEKEELKNMVGSVEIPQAYASLDDSTNRFGRRHVFGDMLEVLEYYGDVKLHDGTILSDHHVVEVAGKYLLLNEENPYTCCPFIYMPTIVDLVTKRGLSLLLPGVAFNETATSIWDTSIKASQFAIDPAYLVSEGTSLVDDQKTIEPGEWIEYHMANPSSLPPQQIENFRNIPEVLQLIPMYEQYINQVTSITPVSEKLDGVAKTATEINELITSSNIVFAAILIDYCKYMIIPAMQVLAKMTAENTDYGAEEKIIYSNNSGEKQIQTINDQIRQGKYVFSVGDYNIANERKAKLNDLTTLVTGMSQLGVKFDTKALWDYAATSQDITMPDRFIQQNPIDLLPPELLQSLQQLASNPQHLMQILQTGMNPPQLPPQVPQPNKIVSDNFCLNIWQDSKLSLETKQLIFKELNVIPPLEVQTEMKNDQIKMQQKLQNLQQGKTSGESTNVDLSKQ